MENCKKMLFVCTIKLCISQYMKLIRLTEMGKHTLPKAILEGFLICITIKMPYLHNIFLEYIRGNRLCLLSESSVM